MLSVSKRIFQKCIQRYRSLSWRLQYVKCKKREAEYCKGEVLRLNSNKILVIVPHADDELFGAYNFIHHNKNRVQLMYCGLVGSDSNELNRIQRQHEFETLCRECSFLYLLSSDIRSDLNKNIKNFDVILLPSIIDWHPEHRLLNRLLFDAVSKQHYCGTIVWYQITVPIMFNQLFFPMTKEEQKEKYECFRKYYISQKQMPLLRFKYHEKLAGQYIKRYAAETFMVFNSADWGNLMEKALMVFNIEAQLNQLKYSINNIEKIRKVCTEIETIFR